MFRFVLLLALAVFGVPPLAIADLISPGGLSDCPVGARTDDIFHRQQDKPAELIFVCPFDPGHTATTRNFHITNDTDSLWNGYRFDVALDNPAFGSNFGWTNGGVFTPSILQGAGELVISGTEALILFDAPLAPTESFTVRLRFADYTGSTARVYGTAIPEPHGLALLGLALLGVVVGRRRGAH